MSTDRKRSVLMHCWSRSWDMMVLRWVTGEGRQEPARGRCSGFYFCRASEQEHRPQAGSYPNHGVVSGDRGVDDLLRLVEQALQVGLVLEAFGVDLVDRLGTRGARSEPAVGGDRLDAADRRAVAGRLVQHLLDLLARQLVALHLRWRQPGQLRFLLGRGGRVDA